MKKFYLLILTVVFLCSSYVSLAVTYTSIAPNAGPYTLDDGRFWVGGVPPPNPCTNCTIIINSNVTVVPDNGTSTSLVNPSPGTPALNDVVLNNCTLQVNGGVTLKINTYLQFFNTTVLIGSDATTAAIVFVNDQVDFNGTSSAQLANVNCYIDANNTFGNTPIRGPHVEFGSATKNAGLYSINAAPDGNGYLYSYTLNATGIGKSTASFAYYTLNCKPTVPASPNICAAGLVFGPATTTADATYGPIFTQSFTLPVELVQFLATKNADASIRLSWATTEELNSSSFEVERSVDLAAGWQKISTVKAKGYSSTTANYSFTDQFPLAGTGYYRLKMIDLDGKFQYSKVVSVSSDQKSQPLVIYSNPFSDQIRLKVKVDRAENLTLTVSDIIGKTYLKQSYNAQAGDNLINLVPAGASSGMYILHIQGNTYDQTVKLARQ